MRKVAYSGTDFLGDAAAVLGAGARGAISGHAQYAYSDGAYANQASDRLRREAEQNSAAAKAKQVDVDATRKAYHDFRANSREAEILRQVQSRYGLIDQLPNAADRAQAQYRYNEIHKEYDRREAPYEKAYRSAFDAADDLRSSANRGFADSTYEAERAAKFMREGDERHKAHAPALLASALMGGAPVGNHTIATPLLTLAGQLGAEALLRRTGAASPHAITHGVAAGAGAALARLGLRGYDAMTEKKPVAPKPRDRKPREKKSYDLSDILGDVAASGLGAASSALGHKSDLSRADAAGWRSHAESAKQDYYNHRTTLSPDQVRGYTRAANRYALEADQLADSQGRNSKLVLGGQGLANLLAPVGDHNVLTPLLSGLGTAGASELLRRYAPGAGTPAHGAAGAAGAMLGRLGLRAFDNVTE